MSFEDAVRGITTTVSLPEDVRCRTCKEAAPPPGRRRTPATLRGKGTLDDNQGLFSLSTVCPKCNGRGTIVDTPCPTCHGTGTDDGPGRSRCVSPGVENGQRIRVKGRGAPGQGMARPAISTWSCGWASMRGSGGGFEPHADVPVSFPEAALGSTVTVPPSKTSDTSCPAGTSRAPCCGSVGVACRPEREERGQGGDLLVKVDVEVPKP